MEFVRARRPEQKEERRARLLATAREMLDEGVSLRELSLNELARRAAMTKSNVYRYFESREAVLLALLEEEWQAWFEGMAGTWRRPAAGKDPLEQAARHLARTLARRPLLCLLTSALPSVLEQNLSEEAVREFKGRSLEFLREAAAFLAERVPGLPREAALRLLHDGVLILVGLYPLAHPAPAVACVLEAPEMRELRHDMDRDLERILLALARDLTARP
jgi:AcrR family transcriptional regulator